MNINNIFIKVADTIGEKLCKRAFWFNSRCNWTGRNLEETKENSKDHTYFLSNRALGSDLYNGTAGISFFLANLYRCIKKEEYRATAEGSIEQALDYIKNIPPICRYGFYSGQIGIAYAASKIGIIFRNDVFIERAISILKNLQKDTRTPHYMDIISGNAGAIPALLEMYDLFQEKSILDLALQLGKELLSVAIKERRGWSWDSRSNGIDVVLNNLTGFSHGTAGIGYSLLELFHKTDLNIFRTATEKAFDYENYWFNNKHDNWPDFRKNKNSIHEPENFRYVMAWCHGAPGIGLSRLYAYTILKDEKYLKDYQAALRSTIAFIKEKKDAYTHNYSLCHGLFGMCELLIYSWKVFNDNVCKSLAENIGNSAARRYGNCNSFWPCGIPGGEMPSLMLGLAGIGYFYLRLYDSQNFPSILILNTSVKKKI
jgi:lantibiotic biosynthesis protein